MDEPTLAKERSARRVWTRLLATVVCFMAFEGLLFHSDLYSTIVEPNSTTGSMELQLRNEIRRQKLDRNQVLAVGHSRMALLPRVANQETPPTGYTFATVALGGSTPRTWYYELRAVDPKASNYAAILIPTDDYNEPDTYDYQTEREGDLHYMIARLRLGDLADFPWSYQNTTLQWTIIRGMLLQGTLYKRDFLDFLDHPRLRIQQVNDVNSHSAAWLYGYGGVDKTLAGLQIDWRRKTVQFPERVTESERKQLEGILFPELPPDGGRETAYLRYWYGRIIDHYRGSRTKLIFLRVPRAPVSPPDPPPKLNSAVRQISTEPNVIVLDEGLFNQLEHPDLFWDAWHLNREGMNQFSKIIAAEVRRVLGAPKS